VQQFPQLDEPHSVTHARTHTHTHTRHTTHKRWVKILIAASVWL
jgi:hypothetical protein